MNSSMLRMIFNNLHPVIFFFGHLTNVHLSTFNIPCPPKIITQPKEQFCSCLRMLACPWKKFLFLSQAAITFVQKLAGAEIRERPPPLDSGAREDDMMEVVNFKRIAMAGWSLGMGAALFSQRLVGSCSQTTRRRRRWASFMSVVGHRGHESSPRAAISVGDSFSFVRPALVRPWSLPAAHTAADFAGI